MGHKSTGNGCPGLSACRQLGLRGLMHAQAATAVARCKLPCATDVHLVHEPVYFAWQICVTSSFVTIDVPMQTRALDEAQRKVESYLFGRDLCVQYETESPCC